VSRVLVVGSIGLDSIETPHGKVEEVLGGSGSYGSVASSWFAPTEVVAVVGTDFPRRYRTQLSGRGVDLSGLAVEQGATFRWSGYYEREMANAHTNTTALNVFENFNPVLTDAQARAPFVFLANIHPDLQLSVLDQLKDPKLVVLDTMNFWIEGTKKQLTKTIKRCGLLMVNEDEARQYMETTSLVEAGEALLDLGPHTVVIKKGEHGGLVFRRDGVQAFPAFPLRKLKDPTGAGDTFAGSMIGHLARAGRVDAASIRKATLVGSVMASFVCEDFSLRRLLKVGDAEIAERLAVIKAMLATPSIPPASLRHRKLPGEAAAKAPAAKAPAAKAGARKKSK
jgi:sugar/nucleoside kinase (ribokinase family)